MCPLDLYQAMTKAYAFFYTKNKELLGGEIFGRHTSLSRWRRAWETSGNGNNHFVKVRPLPQQLFSSLKY